MVFDYQKWKNQNGKVNSNGRRKLNDGRLGRTCDAAVVIY